jgi:hypothetical protein
MSIRLLHAFASAALALAVASGAPAAEPVAGTHRCASVADPTERLACYDTAFPPAADARSGTVDRPSDRDKALSEFGLSKTQLRMRDPEGRDVSPHRIEAGVARVDSRPTGQRVVTLDNGQLWLLTEVTSKGWLKSGDRVVVREAALGSYMLVTPKRVSLRAKRIK